MHNPIFRWHMKLTRAGFVLCITIHNMWFDCLLMLVHIRSRILESAAKVIAKLSRIFWRKFDTVVNADYDDFMT